MDEKTIRATGRRWPRVSWPKRTLRIAKLAEKLLHAKEQLGGNAA